MIETLTIPLLLVIAGLICVVLAIIGKISGKIEIIILPERQRILGGVGVVFLVIGLALGVIIQPTPPDGGITPTPISPITSTPTPSPTATLTPTPTPTPTPCIIIDTMDSTMVWNTYNDSGSSINKKSIPGRTNKALEITYDLKELGWVTFNKRIDPKILSEIEGIRFFYKGTGKPNTIELKLIYSDKDKYDGVDTTFGFSMNAATVKDDWTCVEVPYSGFNCWWSDKSCDDNPGLDLNNVRKIEFAISNKPEGGDEKGSGKVIIDDVQGICPK